MCCNKKISENSFKRILAFGVEGRTRTDDIQNHNLTL